MEERSIAIGGAIRFGWEQLKKNAPMLILAIVLYLLAIFIPLGLSLWASANDIQALFVILYIVYILIALIGSIGLTMMYIKLGRGEEIELSDLYAHWGRVLPYIGTTILYGIIVVVGLILFIIPGVIWAIKYQYAAYLSLDQKLSPVAALNKSGEMTHGLKWDLLGFYVVASLVAYIGIIALGIGIFISGMVAAIAMAFVYNQLLGQSPAAATASE